MITVIGNLKGGSGKSTLAFNLGVWLAQHSEAVVAYDLDPQCTLTDVTEVRREDGHEPTLTVYQLNTVDGKQLQDFAGEVLVDVGAANIPAMRAAIEVADRVVIPVPPSQADVWATQRFLNIVREALPDGRQMDVRGFVNRADTHRQIRETDETVEALTMIDGIRVLPHRLCNRTVYRRSLSEGLAVWEMARRSKAAAEFNALARDLYPGLAPI